MADTLHADWLREGVRGWNLRRKKVSFSPDLSRLNFFDFLPPDFRDSPKTSRYFEKIDLSGANLDRADLSGLNFLGANFSGSNLSNAELSLSNFERADFTEANVFGANFEHSRLVAAKFDRAAIDGVNQFESAELSGAEFIEISSDQVVSQALEAKGAVVFASRLDYRNSLRAILPMGRLVGRAVEKTGAGELGDGKTKKNKYDVFYATNRNAVYERGALTDFGSDVSSFLSYGVSEVIVPEGRRIGTLGSPRWKRLFNRRDDRLRLDHIIPLSEELYWKLLNDTSSQMRVKQYPTIFVHGFNTNFSSAVLRAAQIGYDLGLGQGVGLFSWPSKGDWKDYARDEASVEVSKYLLADYITKFVENESSRRINIIAHSMGCRCLMGALEVLSSGQKSSIGRINQIILAAADVDTRMMLRQGGVAIGRCKRLTSYACTVDRALIASGWLHGYSRVGFAPPTFVLSGMDTVLVNDRDLGDYSHGYVGSSRTILNDIFSLLKQDAPPHERHAIEAVNESGVNYWKIRD